MAGGRKERGVDRRPTSAQAAVSSALRRESTLRALHPILIALLLTSGAAVADEKPQVLVLDLQRGSETPANIARTLTDLLTVEASNHPGLKVLSGADLRSLAELESERAMLGCDDSSCLAELAGAIGARFVITGRVSKLGGLWLMQLSLFDAIAAEAISRVALKATSVEAFVDELPGGVKTLLAGVAAQLSDNEQGAGEPQPAPAATASPPAPSLGTARELPVPAAPQTPTSAPPASATDAPTDEQRTTAASPGPTPSANGAPTSIERREQRSTISRTSDGPADDEGIGFGVYGGLALVGGAALGLLFAAGVGVAGAAVFATKVDNAPIIYRYLGGAVAVGGGVAAVAAVGGVLGGAGLVVGGLVE
jgi:hypothetical protein